VRVTEDIVTLICHSDKSDILAKPEVTWVLPVGRILASFAFDVWGIFKSFPFDLLGMLVVLAPWREVHAVPLTTFLAFSLALTAGALSPGFVGIELLLVVTMAVFDKKGGGFSAPLSVCL